eukprot:CAMPEP_0201505408 /NCGR_PEP_ID=MMETSP0151_2-20130828/85750_1 /ASSEMBLY_ACC=CAM_ASM_000257 /TAXON_ID=200890 /ORGANISM="Paramoeba atlantica, Strain 621/1 / CCAP 1560/9" /LENGTH=718 /DNA_ID=CAMNT_0047899267 /DNA_START=48 /DNA_END=2202 /DNA_ORIENTATION=-
MGGWSLLLSAFFLLLCLSSTISSSLTKNGLGKENVVDLRENFRSLVAQEKNLLREGEEKKSTPRDLKSYDDPLFPLQWHLQPAHPFALNLSFIPNRSGDKVRVSPVTWGFEENNLDFWELINQEESILDGISTPMDATMKQYGTGGISAGFALPDNAFCSVGVASDVPLTVNNLGPDPEVTFGVLADRLFQNTENVDIFSYFVLFGDSQSNARTSFPTDILDLVDHSLSVGRKGKGSILIPTGILNRGVEGHCASDEFSTATGMLLVGGINENGEPITPPCASAIGVLPTDIKTTLSSNCPSHPLSAMGNVGLAAVSSDEFSTATGMLLVGGINENGEPITPPCASAIGVLPTDIKTTLSSNCPSHPLSAMGNVGLAAGTVALLLQKDNTLAWQDVHFVLMETASSSMFPSRGWKKNGAARRFHYDYGFGMINPGAALDYVEKYESQHDPKRKKISLVWEGPLEIPDSNGVVLEIPFDGPRMDGYLQHVEVVLTTQHPHAGDLQISVMSPSRTVVHLNRPFGYNESGTSNWLKLEDSRQIKMSQFDLNLYNLEIFESTTFEYLSLVTVTGNCCTNSPMDCFVSGGASVSQRFIAFFIYSPSCSLKEQEDNIQSLLHGAIHVFVVSEAGRADLKNLEKPTATELGSMVFEQVLEYPENYVFRDVLFFSTANRYSAFEYNNSKLSTPYFWDEISGGTWNVQIMDVFLGDQGKVLSVTLNL